jgi:hypothetical protein
MLVLVVVLVGNLSFFSTDTFSLGLSDDNVLLPKKDWAPTFGSKDIVIGLSIFFSRAILPSLGFRVMICFPVYYWCHYMNPCYCH